VEVLHEECTSGQQGMEYCREGNHNTQNLKEKDIHDALEIKAHRLLLDGVKDHLIHHIGEKNTTYGMWTILKSMFEEKHEKLGKNSPKSPRPRDKKPDSFFFFYHCVFFCVEQQGEWVLFDHAYTKDCDPSIRGEWVLFFP
jgi:hypothetical protein